MVLIAGGVDMCVCVYSIYVCVCVCVQYMCVCVIYLSRHVGGQGNQGPQGGVDAKEHHPESDAAPDGDVTELMRDTHSNHHTQ